MTLRIPVTDTDHIQGHADAAVTLVEYGDYQCPYCGAAYPIVQELQRHFGDDLRFVFRNFPLAEMHPHAVGAAMTAEFGAANGRFWEIHDALYENQPQLGPALYDAIVSELGLEPKQLHKAFEAQEYLARIRTDVDGGVRSGVNGTPSFFVNGARYDGVPDLDTMTEALTAAIHSAKRPSRN
jgi:protein-disulfide isomerase